MIQKKKLLSKVLSLGDRNYTFEVRESRIGKPYLVISEHHKHQQFLIFENQIESFTRELQSMQNFIKTRQSRPWSSKNEQILRKAFNSGKTIPQLARYFAKTEQEICARLVKLGELSKDDILLSEEG